MISLLVLLACNGGGDSATGGVAQECGDVDGDGGDTGDVPSLTGTWTTSTFAGAWWEDLCTAENFNEDSETWIGAFYVEGEAPANLYVYFGPSGEPRTDRFWGAVDKYGGVSFSGQVDHTEGTLHAQFGGKTFVDGNDRTNIVGSAFLGLDVDADDVLDCWGQGNWQAIKSGN